MTKHAGGIVPGRARTPEVPTPMTRRLALVFVIVALICASVSAQDDRPAEEAAPAAGLVESVGRAFEPAGRSSSSIGLLQVRAASFDTEDHASQAMTAWLEQSKGDDVWIYDVSVVRPVAIETVADETQAWIGISPTLRTSIA